MDQETVALWVQVAAVLAALFAGGVALIVSWRERATARRIAAEDRRVSAQQARSLFRLEVMLRLLENLNRGGSSDRDESSRMGAEALTLIGFLGPDVLPRQWEARVGDEAKLRARLAQDDFPQLKKNAIEVQLAVLALSD